MVGSLKLCAGYSVFAKILEKKLEQTISEAVSKALSELIERKWKGVNGRREEKRNGPRAKLTPTRVLYRTESRKQASEQRGDRTALAKQTVHGTDLPKQAHRFAHTPVNTLPVNYRSIGTPCSPSLRLGAN